MRTLLDGLKMGRLDAARQEVTPGRWFWALVDRGHPMDCWPCKEGHRLPSGYVFLRFEGEQIYAHRLAFLISGGTLVPGMVIMHSCDNPPCCNPAHLQQGTYADNIHDAITKGRFRQHTTFYLSEHRRPKTHCKHGHPMVEGNVYLRAEGKGKTRICRTCLAATRLRAYRKRRNLPTEQSR